MPVFPFFFPSPFSVHILQLFTSAMIPLQKLLLVGHTTRFHCTLFLSVQKWIWLSAIFKGPNR